MMRRRTPRDPEEGGRIHIDDNRRSRRGPDPPTARSQSSPEASIQLSERQLEMLARHRSRNASEPVLTQQPFVTRSNLNIKSHVDPTAVGLAATVNGIGGNRIHNSDKQNIQQLPSHASQNSYHLQGKKDPPDAPKHGRAAPPPPPPPGLYTKSASSTTSAPSSSVPSKASNRAPSKADNPATRDRSSSASIDSKGREKTESHKQQQEQQQQRAFLRNMLQKASSTAQESSQSGTGKKSSSSTGTDQKAILRKVLSKSMAKKKPSHSNNSRGSETMHSSSSGSSLRSVDKKTSQKPGLAEVPRNRNDKSSQDKSRPSRIEHQDRRNDKSSQDKIRPARIEQQDRRYSRKNYSDRKDFDPEQLDKATALATDSSPSPRPKNSNGNRSQTASSASPVRPFSIRDRLRRAKKGTREAPNALVQAPVAAAPLATPAQPSAPRPAPAAPQRPRPPSERPKQPRTQTLQHMRDSKEALAALRQGSVSPRNVPESVAPKNQLKPEPVKKRNQRSDGGEEKKEIDRFDDSSSQGYSTFLQTLRNEASGQHSQLWTNFSSLVQGKERKDVAGLSTVRGRPVKFDSKTKKRLTSMNMHLKSNYPAADCQSQTQLVNDRTYRKEVDTASSGSIQAVSSMESDAIMQTRSSSPAAHSDIQKHREMRALTDSLSFNTEETGRSMAKRRSLGSPVDEKPNVLREDPSEKGDFENSSNPGMEVTLGQYQTNFKPESIPEDGGMPAWSNVRLKSVNDAVSARSNDSSVGAEKADSAPAWANVKLRPVDDSKRRRESTSPVIDLNEAAEEQEEEEDSLTTLCLSPIASRVVADSAPAPIFAPESTDDGATEESEVSQSTLAMTLSSSLLVGSSSSSGDAATERDVNRHDAVATNENRKRPAAVRSERTREVKEGDTGPAKHPGNKIDEAVVVRLKQASSVPDEGRVIVGKKMLMTVQSAEGEAQAIVMWKLPRGEIHSLTLDMATLKVNLLLVKDGGLKTLAFHSSEDCLRFANAFYEMSSTTASAPNTDVQNLAVGDVNEAQAPGDESCVLEQLNDEEQTVLETYRRLRRTKPAQDALQETISRDSKQETPASLMVLSSEDERTMERYRKMIKHGIPLDAVKHKMKQDGTEEKIVTAVASETLSGSASGPPSIVEADCMPSSPVSTMSSSVALSAAQLEVAESYRIMLERNVPANTVKDKMEENKVDPKIVGFVLGDNCVDSKAILSEEQEKAAGVYRNMLKMSVPADAVRHRMIRDQVDEKIVVAVFGKSEAEETKNPAQQLEAEEEAIAAPYRKMISLKIPKDAVRHKMLKDGIEQKIVNVVLGKEDDGSPDDNASPVASVPVRKKAVLTLSDEEESVASLYRKMLKLQIPKDSVFQRMQKEGVSEKIINSVVGERTIMSKPSTDSRDSQSKCGSRLVSLHWTPLTGKELDESVWKASKKQNASSAEPEGSDISKLIQLFQKKSITAVAKEKSNEEAASVTQKAKLLDLTRANNIAISLKAFKEFSFTELSDIIAFLDPMRKIRGERVQFIRDLLPTATESKIIKAFNGSPDKLVPAELWFQQIAKVNRIDLKVQVMRTMEMFNSEAASLLENFRLLNKVCQQVVKSEKLRDLLGMILMIGNKLNEGTRTGGAAGFKFDSLLKLTQTKSSDGKTTVLDFLVTIFVTKGLRETLNLSSDFPDCQTASRLLISDMTNEVKSMDGALKECKDELQALKDEVSGRRKPGRSAKKLGSEISSSSAGGSSALMASILARAGCGAGVQKDEHANEKTQKPVETHKRGHDSDVTGEQNNASSLGELLKTATAQQKVEVESSISPRSMLLASAKKDSSGRSVHGDTELDRNSMKGGIARLEEFIVSGDATFTRLKTERDAALKSCREMSKYCAESGGVSAATTLLGILAEFASNIDGALKKYDTNHEATSRKQRKKIEIRFPRDRATNGEDSSEPKDQGKSLVLMVNDMLKSANEKTKEDFKKGRVYPNPSAKLKAIYEREKEHDVSPSRRLDIVSAIRQRQEFIDSAEVRHACSQFSRVVSEDGEESVDHKRHAVATPVRTQRHQFSPEKETCALPPEVARVRSQLLSAQGQNVAADNGSSAELEFQKVQRRFLTRETNGPSASEEKEERPSTISSGDECRTELLDHQGDLKRDVQQSALVEHRKASLELPAIQVGHSKALDKARPQPRIEAFSQGLTLAFQKVQENVLQHEPVQQETRAEKHSGPASTETANATTEPVTQHFNESKSKAPEKDAYTPCIPKNAKPATTPFKSGTEACSEAGLVANRTKVSSSGEAIDVADKTVAPSSALQAKKVIVSGQISSKNELSQTPARSNGETDERLVAIQRAGQPPPNPGSRPWQNSHCADTENNIETLGETSNGTKHKPEAESNDTLTVTGVSESPCRTEMHNCGRRR